VQELWDKVSPHLKTDTEGFVVIKDRKLLVNGKPIKTCHKEALVK